MKFIYLLMVVAFLGISASVARADGVDPIVTTKGCGGTTGTICDPEILTPGNTTLTVTEAFHCDALGNNCTAEDSVINETGVAINSFSLVLDNLDGTLSYTCGTGGFFTCALVAGTNNTFTFAGGANSICADSDDLKGGTFTPDGDECGVIIHLAGAAGESLAGVTVTGTFSTAAPEPSSGLLLMAGLMAGLVSLKTLRSNPS